MDDHHTFDWDSKSYPTVVSICKEARTVGLFETLTELESALAIRDSRIKELEDFIKEICEWEYFLSPKKLSS